MPIRDDWLKLRNRLLSSPRFQRWAARFPLTRPLARRHARELFDIVAGFVYSQVLYACVRARLFELLDERGPSDSAALAPALGLPEEGARRLLLAAASLRLVEQRGADRFALGERGAVVLGNRGIAAMVEHHAMLYADLEDPLALLRGERPQRALADYWAYAESSAPARSDAAAVDGYSALMADSQAMIAEEVLDAYSFRDHHCLLDIAGGDGTFLVEVAKRWPHLQVILFDLPAVAERAQARFVREGLAERARAVGGDVLRDPLPEGADVVSLVRVVHDHDDERAAGFVAAAHRALAPGGTLLVAEPMSGTRGAEPVGDAYFGLYLLAMGSGRPRTAAELEAMLAAAGFEQTRELPTNRPILTRALLARRASD
ncbi:MULTISPECIES: methyltransferase [Marichromatium]|uniref:Demethylspheroidene O-methyltransferase n=1 Tax=Marichromatium gracile TaxID=1048 RepID=A0A4R4AGN1_MARGR|nr:MULTISPECIES: methyltransferase [Marichromatium]MBO8085138.1 methyltransferase domain-containing protein [Marichromatium sp.]MBK1707868.1 methyltransferase [Marichromatium gracile]RNE88811.1 methyltransferase domain-containing protein [Marichromatium sp. AB31]RNE92419.1 methyltransferase domain-containing protein [Marichromatium sp. AB32]TCW38383.1 demethylspheroidene O-methyltransferase [Marichromatium gracile]